MCHGGFVVNWVPMESFWNRLFAITGIVTLGFSQPFFNMVVSSPDWFYGDAVFFTLILFWVFIVPLVVLLLADTLVLRSGKRAFLYWRALLYLALCVSLIRQFVVVHNAIYQQFLGFLPMWLPYVIAALVLIPLFLRSRVVLPQFLSILGFLSLFFTINFVRNTHLLSSTWSHPASTQALVNKPGPPVFFVVFDEFSYDVLGKSNAPDPALFPNFAALARDGAWFTNATTNHWATLQAIPTLLTGKLDVTPDTPTIFEALRENYRVTMIDTEMGVERWMRTANIPRNVGRYSGKSFFLRSNPLVCAEYLFDLLKDSHFLALNRKTDPYINSYAYHLTLDRELKDFLSTIDSKNANGRMVFWHLSIPHSPFLFSADGKIGNDQDANFPFPDNYDSSEFDSIWKRYREQARYSDRVLGIIIAKLKEQHLFDQALLVVTGDHGARIWGDIYHHLDLIAHVPLVLHGPGIEPGVYSNDVQHVDLAPTLLTLLGRPFRPSDYDGRPIFGTNSERSKVLLIQAQSLPRQEFIYDAASDSWKPHFEKNSSGGSLSDKLASAGLAAQTESPFSAVMVLNDLMESQDTGKDFLSIYLRQHFPRNATDADIQDLRDRLRASESLADSPRKHYSRGILCFFLALEDTYKLSTGKEVDVAGTNQLWQESLREFKKASNLEAGMVQAIPRILQDADSDHNGTLNSQELISIVKSRT